MKLCKHYKTYSTVTVDMGFDNSSEVRVWCDGEFHFRDKYTDRNGWVKEKAVICMCPDENMRIRDTQNAKDKKEQPYIHDSWKRRIAKYKKDMGVGSGVFTDIDDILVEVQDNSGDWYK